MPGQTSDGTVELIGDVFKFAAFVHAQDAGRRDRISVGVAAFGYVHIPGVIERDRGRVGEVTNGDFDAVAIRDLSRGWRGGPHTERSGVSPGRVFGTDPNMRCWGIHPSRVGTNLLEKASQL